MMLTNNDSFLEVNIVPDNERLRFLLERKVWKEELWLEMLDTMTPTPLWPDGAPGFDGVAVLQ